MANLNTHTRVRRNCRFPLYHVMIAFGRDPLLSHLISYLRSATNCDGVSNISTVNGRTVKINSKNIDKILFRLNCDKKQ